MNRATRIVATTIGIVFAISGLSHGFYLALQGNTPTDGLVVGAIAEDIANWEHGEEPALTIIPNYLLAGITTMVVSIGIIIWCTRYLHTRHGATVFLGLFIVLFLVGGGIAQVIFFIPTWAFATRINAPLTWWRKRLPRFIAPFWSVALGLGSGAMILGLVIAVFGYPPGLSNPDVLMNIMIGLLISAITLFTFSFLSAFAYDIAQQTPSTPTLVFSKF